MQKILGLAALVAALVPHVQAGGGCSGGGCPPDGGYAMTCNQQEDCLTWEVNRLETDSCGLGGDCPIEVCMIIDTTLPNCDCAPLFDRVCDHSDVNGCPNWHSGLPTFENDGLNVGEIRMCQKSYPGAWLAWVIQDGWATSHESKWMPGFYWKPDCCAQVYCENYEYECADAYCTKSKARTWWFKVPQDHNGCNICDEPPTGPPPPPPPPTPPGSNGDPHFKTWNNEHFEYHGQCDMVLTKDKEFADGLGLEVQIRTKLVRYWSYIKNVAIRIGDDILEIEGAADPEVGKTHYWMNLEYNGPIGTLGGFPVDLYIRSQVKRRFTIDLDSKFPGQKIVVYLFKEFVKVDFVNASEESYGNSIGMLGEFKTGQTLGRDGVTVIDDFTTYGNEWQVLPSEGMLFHDISDPQFPKKCIDPEDPQGERRRRLDETTVSEEEAEKACSTLQDPLDRKDCVYDILATQDLDMIGAF